MRISSILSFLSSPSSSLLLWLLCNVDPSLLFFRQLVSVLCFAPSTILDDLYDIFPHFTGIYIYPGIRIEFPLKQLVHDISGTLKEFFEEPDGIYYTSQRNLSVKVYLLILIYRSEIGANSLSCLVKQEILFQFSTVQYIAKQMSYCKNLSLRFS